MILFIISYAGNLLVNLGSSLRFFQTCSIKKTQADKLPGDFFISSGENLVQITDTSESEEP